MSRNRSNKQHQGNRSASAPQSTGKERSKQQQRAIRRQQPKKDSNAKRVNYDNAREDKVAERIERDAKSGKFNDVNDFLKNPVLLKAAASYPVFPILGSAIGQAKPAPGIMTFGWTPNFGSYQYARAKNYKDKRIEATKDVIMTPPPLALNQASDSTYSFLVHANSRNYAYNSPDLFILILAGAQVFAIIAAMKRAYGLAKYYVETNQYVPDTLLAALGFKAQDLRQNLGQAWFDLNNLIIQTRQIWVPDAFPIVNRWIDLNSHVYSDAEGLYSQLYAYVQTSYFKYEEKALQSGGGLIPVPSFEPGKALVNVNGKPCSTRTYNWSAWVAAAQSMIDALINSEDRGIIYGDLLNAYTAQRIIALSEIDSSYSLLPEYSPEISMQVENTIVVPESFAPIGLVQYDNKLFPVYTDASKATGTVSVKVPEEFILNFHTQTDPSPEMILLATRFHPLGVMNVTFPTIDSTNVDPTLGSAWVLYTAGSEIITQASIATGLYDPNESNASRSAFSAINWNQAEGGTTVLDKTFWMRAMAFDWHMFGANIPTTNIDAAPPAVSTTEMPKLYGQNPQEYFGDFDRYSVSQLALIKKINDTAEFSLYGVPQL